MRTSNREFGTTPRWDRPALHATLSLYALFVALNIAVGAIVTLVGPIRPGTVTVRDQGPSPAVTIAMPHVRECETTRECATPKSAPRECTSSLAIESDCAAHETETPATQDAQRVANTPST